MNIKIIRINTILFFAFLSIFTHVFPQSIGNDENNGATIANLKDHYDYDHETIIKELGTFSISVENDKIIFDSIHGDVTDQILYDRNDTNFNFDNVYKVISNEEFSYFRFGWQSYKNGKSVFSSVKWLEGKRLKSGTYQINVVKLKFIQYGSISVCTIGDSQTWWFNAGELRLFIKSEMTDIFFTGTRTDFNGYPHEGEGGNSTVQVLERVNYIPRADYFTLLIGTNDWKNGIESARNNIIQITSFLLNKYPGSKVLYITPLPTTNKIRDDFNTQLKEKLVVDFSKNERILVINVGEEMRENPQCFKEYFDNDGLHPDINGVRLMAKSIAKKIKSDR